jgi:hypothetical protein
MDALRYMPISPAGYNVTTITNRRPRATRETRLIKGGAHHFFAPCLFILLFDPRRRHSSARPHIAVAVARSEGQGRCFFSAAEGLSLTNASTAANCP